MERFHEDNLEVSLDSSGLALEEEPEGAEGTVAEAIQSAIGQTWARKEIIVVDDGSRDRTAEVARRFALAEIVVFFKENHGAAAARNHAL